MAVLRVRLPQNRQRRGVVLRVAQADVNDVTSPLRQEPRSGVMQHYERPAAFFAADLHVLPAKLASNPGAERFGDGLLRGEARGDVGRGELVREAILDFVRAQDALKKTVAKFLQRAGDAADFNDVDANAEDHGG